jgi:hypothetical protein
MASIIDNTLSNNDSRTLAPAAVGSQVALMSIVSVSRQRSGEILRCESDHLSGRYHPLVQFSPATEQGMSIAQSSNEVQCIAIRIVWVICGI